MPRLTWKSLVEQYGIDEAERLCRQYGGCRFPRITQRLRERIERDRLVLEELDDGVPASDIADRYGISKSRVIGIGKEIPPKSPVSAQASHADRDVSPD